MQKIGYVIIVNNDRFVAVDSRPNDLLVSDVFEAARFFHSAQHAETIMNDYIMQQNRNGMHKFKVQTVALLA